MKDFFDIIKEFVPLWLALITLGFAFLIFLYTKIFKQTNDLAEKQNQYLKDKVDIIDKTTSIFEKTFLHQEKSIEQLNNENKHLKENLEEYLKKFQEIIEFSKKIKERKIENQNNIENSSFENRFKEIYFIYKNITPIIILLENVTNYNYLPIKFEFLDSFEHIMKSMSENSDIDKEFQKAKSHLIRAGLDAAQLLVSEKIKIIKNINLKSIEKYCPEYFTEIKPQLGKIIINMNQYRNKDLSSDEQFLDYQNIVAEIIDVDNKINSMISKSPKMKLLKKRLF